MKIIDVITGMALPKICDMCGRELVAGEESLCLHCMAELRGSLMFSESARAERLPFKAPVARVVSWIPYVHDSPVCALIRRGKYEGRPDLIEKLSSIYASMLVGEGALEGVDVLLPVGMHWWKRMRRGYNQADIVARTVGRVGGLPVSDAIRAARPHMTQTRRSAAGRAENVSGMFRVAGGERFNGLHVGVVDDILTTGATLSEAIGELLPFSPSAISVYTLAMTVGGS